MRCDCFAAASDAAGLEGVSVLAILPEEGISVFEQPLPDLATSGKAQCRPVYAFSGNQPPAIPTGRIFVQGGKGANLGEIVNALGYEIEDRPPYAPNSAWIVASDRSIASALSNLQHLMAAAGLESVEPQMLRPLNFRSARQ